MGKVCGRALLMDVVVLLLMIRLGRLRLVLEVLLFGFLKSSCRVLGLGRDRLLLGDLRLFNTVVRSLVMLLVVVVLGRSRY